jgi:hypothetical protein
VIASLLVAVLMASVYQTLFIYRKLFERGETQTEEIQLVRTLSQQLSDDLVGAIQDPVFIDPKSRGPSGARRFGLFGTATELRIDVLQIPAFQVAPTPTALEMEDTTKPRKLQAPELRTVYYSFYESISLDSTLPDARVGLTRRELDFETPEILDEGDVTGLAEVSPAEAVPAEQAGVVTSSSTFDQLLEVGMDSSVMWAPEVVAMKFRYFDGSKWRKSWDSLARKGLPVAVEMTVAVASLDDADRLRGAASGMVEGMGGATVSEDTSLPEGVPVPEDELLTRSDVTEETSEVEPTAQKNGQKNLPPLHVHRVVIHVPNSPLMKARKAAKRQSAPTLDSPTLATPAPLSKMILQPAQPKQNTRRVAPDQWMRNE